LGVFAWYSSSVTATYIPGEIYLFVNEIGLGFGGTVHIFHTTDYFANWTEIIHDIDPYGTVYSRNTFYPGQIELLVFPNPSNNSVNIQYNLDTYEDVRLFIYNSVGRLLWNDKIGWQNPGAYLYSYSAVGIPSGIYFLEVRTERVTENIPFTIIK